MSPGNVYNISVDIARAEDGRTILYATNGQIKKVGNVQVNSLNIRGSGLNSNFDNSIHENKLTVNIKSTQKDENYSSDDSLSFKKISPIKDAEKFAKRLLRRNRSRYDVKELAGQLKEMSKSITDGDYMGAVRIAEKAARQSGDCPLIVLSIILNWNNRCRQILDRYCFDVCLIISLCDYHILPFFIHSHESGAPSRNPHREVLKIFRMFLRLS